MTRATFAVLAAAVCFGTTGTAQALADVDASPLAVGAARIIVGGALLAIVALAMRARAAGDPSAAPAVGLRTRPRPVAIAVGALGVLAYQPAFFAGTRMNGVAIGTVIALGSAPVLTGAADALLRRHLPSARWALATLVALVGVALVSGVGGGEAVSALGVAASVGAGASYAVYTLASKALIDGGSTPASAMGAVFGTAAAASVPVLVVAGGSWVVTWPGAALVAWLGVVTTAVAYVLFGWGLGRLPSPTVSTLTLAEPLTATLCGLAILGERLNAAASIGLMVLAAGIALLTFVPREARPAS